jgi:hypothetical protein
VTDFEEPVLAEHGLQLSPASSHLRNTLERERETVCSLERERERERVSERHGGGGGREEERRRWQRVKTFL